MAAIAVSVPSSLRHCTAVQILNPISNSVLELNWTDCSECVLARTSSPFLIWELCEHLDINVLIPKLLDKHFIPSLDWLSVDKISCLCTVLSGVLHLEVVCMGHVREVEEAP